MKKNELLDLINKNDGFKNNCDKSSGIEELSMSVTSSEPANIVNPPNYNNSFLINNEISISDDEDSYKNVTQPAMDIESSRHNCLPGINLI